MTANTAVEESEASHMSEASTRYRVSLYSMSVTGDQQENAYVVGIAPNSINSVITDIIQPVIKNIQAFNTGLSTPVENTFTGVLSNNGYKQNHVTSETSDPVSVSKNTFLEFPATTTYRFVLGGTFLYIDNRADAYSMVELSGENPSPASEVIGELIDNITVECQGVDGSNGGLFKEYFFCRFHDTDRLEVRTHNTWDLESLRDRRSELPDNRNKGLYQDLYSIGIEINNPDEDTDIISRAARRSHPWELHRLIDRSLLWTWEETHEVLRGEPEETYTAVEDPAFAFIYDPSTDTVVKPATPTGDAGFTVLGDTYNDMYRIDTPVISKQIVDPEITSMCSDITTTRESYNPNGVNATGKPVYEDIQTTMKIPYKDNTETLRPVLRHLLRNWEAYVNERVFNQILYHAGITSPTTTNSPTANKVRASFQYLDELLYADEDEIRMRTSLSEAEAAQIVTVTSAFTGGSQ